jgi:hypothetical protein
MCRSSNAASRCAALLMAGAALACPVAQAGMVVLENQLPVAASCVVETRFGVDFDAEGLGVLQHAQLLDTQLVPSSTHVVPVATGLWPVQLRFDRFGTPYTVSPSFIDLELRCRVGQHDHAAVFANPDFWEGAGAVHSDDSTSSLGRERYTDTHALPNYTPTDRTGFVARLVAESEQATAAQLLEGASVAVELSAMPLLANGAPLHDAPRWIGRFKMVTSPLADDVTPSGSARSGSASNEDPSERF